MKNWLDNVTDAQIADFVGAQQTHFKEIHIKRKNDVVGVRVDFIIETDSCIPGEYDVDHKSYYFNSYGEGYCYKGFMLKPLDKKSLEWFDMVNKANEGIRINGVSYVDDFVQHHKQALEAERNVKKSILDSKIAKLEKQQLDCDKDCVAKIAQLYKTFNLANTTAQREENLLTTAFNNRKAEEKHLAAEDDEYMSLEDHLPLEVGCETF